MVGQTEAARIEKGHRPVATRISRKEFLAACPDAAAAIFERVIDEAARRGLVVSWATRSLVLRARRADGSLASMLYGMPPGVLGRDVAVLQAYVGLLRPDEATVELREKILAIPGLRKCGDKTFELILTSENEAQVLQLAEVMFDVADALSGKSAVRD